MKIKDLRKEPFKAYELFDLIYKILKEKNLVPEEILDYAQSSHYGNGDTPITYYEFDIEAITNYGGNEGIYTDIYISGIFNEYADKRDRVRIGCFKTLSTKKEDFYKMAKVGADFYMEATDYININIEDFTFIGWNIGYKPNDEDDEIKWLYEVRAEERIVYNLKNLLKYRTKVGEIKYTAENLVIFSNRNKKLLTERDKAHFIKMAQMELEEVAYA